MLFRSLQILGPEHPSTATTLHQLAWLYQEQGNLSEAELLYQRALVIMEQKLGPDHPSTRTAQANYAVFLQDRKQKRTKKQ